MKRPFARWHPSVLVLTAVIGTPAVADMMGWYQPLHLGATWTYQQEGPPYDVVADSVFALIEYEGHPAYRFGTDIDDHRIVWSEAGTVYLYAVVTGGVLLDLEEDVALGEVVDGGYFAPCFAAPCDTSLIRVWEALDPDLRSVYGVDPGLTDLIVWAAYDPDFPPNLHNTVLESNLPAGVEPPAGAVTGIDLYRRNFGLIESWDVDAASGGLFEHYVLVEVAATGVTAGRAPCVSLERVVPNPCNPRTTVGYRLAAPGTVTVGIFDLGGRAVRILDRGTTRDAGTHEVAWDGADDRGCAVATGVYFCRVHTASGVALGKICLVR